MKYIIHEKLAALWGKLTANRLPVRMLALLLALVLLQGDFMLPAHATEGEDSDTSAQTSTETTTTDIPSSVQEQAEQAELPVDEDTLIVTLDGAETSFFELPSHEKAELFAEGLEQQADYQWQIRHPENGAWINIYDATEQRLSVSAALVKNMLSEDGTAALRCRAYTEEYAYLSNSIRVALLENIESVADSVQLLSLDDPTVPLADGDDPLPEFVTITIQYLRYDNVLQSDGTTFVEMEIGQAFTSYVATVKSTEPGEDPTPLSAVHCPTIVGYTPQLTSITKGGNELSLEPNDFQTTVTDGVSNYYVHFREEPFTADLVYRVEYHPAEVQYKIRYFFQNIYDDLYVENADLVKTSLGKTSYPLVENGYTGKHPDKNYTEAQFSGFTSLYYEPEFIAADGSTIFEVYYERNYYLMEFDCNEGYGTDTVYVRYGTYISVPDPVRSGWVFAGWDLVKTDDPNNTADLGTEILDGNNASTGFHTGDGTKNALPSAMPAYNSAYKALWAQGDTTYSVAYWILDSNGNKTYIGGRTENASSGITVSGKHDLGTKASGGKVICGLQEHTHSDSCYICGSDEHKHTTSCFDGMTLVQNDPGNGINIIKQLETPESGYIYVVYSAKYGRYWPKLYLEDSNGNGTYYVVNGTEGGYNEESFSAIIEGDSLGYAKGTYNGEDLAVNKYKPNTACDTTQHIHGTACRTCEEHAHSNSCYQDVNHMLEVDSFTYENAQGEDVTISTDTDVLVEGDGSTVVNVYYQYKEYTLKFYYAATTGGTENDTDGDPSTYDSIKVVGGSTWDFGEDDVTGPDDGPQLANVGGWGFVDELPSLNATGQKKNYSTGELTYNNTTYHYISFKARYGDNISDLWPCAVFNSVTRTSSNTHGYWSGTEAFVSAWNGEYRVKYSREHTNETIKGIYERLDDNLLFHSDYTDETEVSYLCFWENGADIYWSVPELYRYNIWLEGTAPNNEPTVTRNGVITYLADGTKTTRNGVTFYLANTYDTCDDSDVGAQTQPGLTGYTPSYFPNWENQEEADNPDNFQSAEVAGLTPVRYFEYKTMADTTDAELLKQTGYYDSSLYREGYDVNFYYTSSEHTLKFMNHNEWLTDGSGVSLRYGTSLQKYGAYVNSAFMAQPANYPETLEPSAYEFAGWYTTSNFISGTEMDWNSVMPDNDLKVYAYWRPVIRNVYFYYDYADYAHAKTVNFTDTNDFWFHTENGEQVPDEYPIEVEHGSLVGTTYSNIPDEQNGYTFVGWFYMDESNKKRFAPDSMEVKRDLHLFAEWQSGIDTQYTVTYVLDQPYKGYAAGAAIAAPTTGHLTAGKTKTFTAKVGLDLLTPFNEENLFPLINSHSILMDSDQSKNTYEFRYLHDESVWYKVRYVNKITGVEMCDPKIETSTSAIITEKFRSFTGFIPDNYYIRKALAYDGDATGPSDQNEIIFYYTPDQEHGLFVIEYYTEKLDGTWYLEQSEIGSEDLNVTKTVTIDPDRFTGFDYSHTEITTYDAEGNSNVETTTNQSVSGTITQNGLELRIYYTRKSYDYIVEFLEVGTNKLLGYGRVNSTGEILKNTDGTRVFNLPDSAQHKYKSTIQYDAPDLIEQTTTKYLFYSTAEKPQTQSLIIDASNTETVDDVTTRTSNVLTFYYKAREVLFEYKAVCPTAPDAANFGRVSLESETVSNTTNISGATAIPGVGFNFVGWYSDEACTDANQISANLQFKPQSIPNDVDNVTYYARFDPILTSMAITKTVTGELPNGMANDDTFLFHVKGQGKHEYLELTVAITVTSGTGSVTIEKIPLDDYIVTELTNWSWEYALGGTAAQNITLVSAPTNVVAFTNEYTNPDWLGGECYKDNNFN